MSEHWPAEIPPRWMASFAVEDCAAYAVSTAGGTVSARPTGIPTGRIAVLRFFSVITFGT